MLNPIFICSQFLIDSQLTMAILKTASEFHEVRSSGIGARVYSKVPCYSIFTFRNDGILRYIFTFSVTSVLYPFLATAEKSKIFP